jgi:hypothetical protein
MKDERNGKAFAGSADAFFMRLFAIICKYEIIFLSERRNFSSQFPTPRPK